MKTITLKLTNLQIAILQTQLHENICAGYCFMKHYNGHTPKADCNIKCKKQKALFDLRQQINKELEK